MSKIIKYPVSALIAVICVMFLCCAYVGCGQQKNVNVKTRVESLKGPTSVGIAQIMKDSAVKYDFKIVAQADAIVSDVAAGNVDIALVPANIASVLYKKTNGGVKVIDINTLGVLHCVSQNAGVKTMTDLKGKTVYMAGKGTIPQYTLDILLKANNMTEADINLEFKSEVIEVISLISKDPNVVGIINEPQATIATQKNNKLHKIIDFTAAWKEVFGSDQGEPITGVTIVRSDFLKDHKDAVDDFIKAHKDSTDAVKTQLDDVVNTLVNKGVLEKTDSLKEAVTNCAVACITGNDMKTQLSAYLSKLNQENTQLIGGQIPDDNFYYLR